EGRIARAAFDAYRRGLQVGGIAADGRLCSLLWCRQPALCPVSGRPWHGPNDGRGARGRSHLPSSEPCRDRGVYLPGTAAGRCDRRPRAGGRGGRTTVLEVRHSSAPRRLCHHRSSNSPCLAWRGSMRTQEPPPSVVSCGPTQSQNVAAPEGGAGLGTAHDDEQQEWTQKETPERDRESVADDGQCTAAARGLCAALRGVAGGSFKAGAEASAWCLRRAGKSNA